jgi:catalase-peroxidase
VLATGLGVAQLAGAAWASASTFRGTDYRGGANGARIRLEPQRSWAVNEGVGEVLAALEDVKRDFDGAGGRTVSMADLVVLAGCAAVEKAARDAGHEVRVPFTPGRTDATDEMTDAESFSVLEPRADGFRNYLRDGEKTAPERLLLEKATLLTLTAPEMTALVGGMRALGVTAPGTSLGLFTERPGQLTNDFFVGVLENGRTWRTSATENVYESEDGRFTATAADLVFGSHSQLRAISEVYGSVDGEARFVADFVAAWDKVMMLDRFDVR